MFPAGVLLRKLEAGLIGISHVVVDEIHERDINVRSTPISFPPSSPSSPLLSLLLCPSLMCVCVTVPTGVLMRQLQWLVGWRRGEGEVEKVESQPTRH